MSRKPSQTQPTSPSSGDIPLQDKIQQAERGIQGVFAIPPSMLDRPLPPWQSHSSTVYQYISQEALEAHLQRVERLRKELSDR
jgi:hypothetical protein